jgi:MFS family permease
MSANSNLHFLVIITLNFFLSATYSMPFSIFPLVATNKGVSHSLIGLIFSVFPLGSIIPSLIFAKMMKIWGRIKLLLISCFLLGVSTTLFGILERFESSTAFIAVAIVSRIIQGMACGGFCTVAYAIIALLYRDSLVKKQTFMVLSFTVGVGLGPIIGGGLYELFNYEVANYFFSGIAFVSLPTLFLLPASADGNMEEGESSTKISNFLLNRRYAATIGLIIINFSGFTFIYVSLEEHLKEFGSGPVITGFFIAELTMSYFLSMILLNFLPRKIDRRTWIILGTAIEFLSFFLVGPNPFFISKSNPLLYYFIGLGIFLCGFGGGLSILPILPELIDIGRIHISLDEESVGDVASACNNIGFQVGEFLGPILGGVFGEWIGFGHGASLFGVFILAYGIIYVGGGGGWEAFGSKRRASSANVIMQLKDTEMEHCKRLLNA